MDDEWIFKHLDRSDAPRSLSIKVAVYIELEVQLKHWIQSKQALGLEETSWLSTFRFDFENFIDFHPSLFFIRSFIHSLDYERSNTYMAVVWRRLTMFQSPFEWHLFSPATVISNSPRAQIIDQVHLVNFWRFTQEKTDQGEVDSIWLILLQSIVQGRSLCICATWIQDSVKQTSSIPGQ